MSHAIDGLDDETLRDILLNSRRIALVGASDNPDRASHEVMGFLLARGYRVVPVNPGLAGRRIHDQTVVATLAEAGEIDMVDVFRASRFVAPVMEAAIHAGARVVWMQLGVIDTVAAEAGRAAGLKVVMDRCPKIEWPRLGLTRLH